MDGEPKGLHVENPLGRFAPQLPCDCDAAFYHCKRGAFGRVPFHIFGKQRSEFVPPFRLTKAELRELKARAKASGLRLSEYLRRQVMGGSHEK